MTRALSGRSVAAVRGTEIYAASNGLAIGGTTQAALTVT